MIEVGIFGKLDEGAFAVKAIGAVLRAVAIGRGQGAVDDTACMGVAQVEG